MGGGKYFSLSLSRVLSRSTGQWHRLTHPSDKPLVCAQREIPVLKGKTPADGIAAEFPTFQSRRKKNNDKVM